VPVGAGRTVRAVSAGGVHTCAVLDDATLRCFGFGGSGQLGYSSMDSVGTGTGPTPTIVSAGAVPVGGPVRAISAGGGHTCAILDDGSVRCWGTGADGRLGYDNTTNVGDGVGPSIVTSGAVPLGRPARAISAGSAHTCAILDDGTVRCWGTGASGRLGYGNTTNVGDGVGPSIVAAGAVPLGRPARAISAGASQTCAILDDATLRCWGAGSLGQLGYGNTTNVGDGVGPSIATAGAVPLGAGAIAIAAGNNITTCAMLDDGTGRCFGGGAGGQLGYGNTNTVGAGSGPTPTIASAGPLPVGAGRTIRMITDSTFHGAALLDDGTLRAWGSGGRLGYGNVNNVGSGAGPTPTIVSAGPVPVPEPLVATIADLSVGIGASAAALTVGSSGTVGVTVANAGPDPAPGVVVAVQAPGMAPDAATASQGGFDAGTGIWTLGTVPAGGQATLSLPVAALAAGVVTATAELLALDGLDPDSTAANAAPGEDDRATTQINVAAVQSPPPDPVVVQVPVAVPVVLPVDAVAPKLTTSVPSTIALDKLRKGLTASATPNEAATISFELLATLKNAKLAAVGDLVLATKSFPRDVGKRTVKIVPSRRLLGTPRKAFRLRVRITALDAARNATTVTRTVKVTIPKPKKKG
jgi:alpha-tubulin suppressor-like RCC1 family protein